MEGSEASAGRLDRGKHAGPIEVHPHVHGTQTDSHADPSGMTKLSAEEPDALMHARPGPWEPWRVTARATQPNGANLDVNRLLVISSASSATLIPCRPAVPQPLQVPKNGMP